MDVSSPLGSVDPATLTVAGYDDTYPTPPPVGSETPPYPSDDQPTKRKRKAWGQPVPEIKQILPPRKRAKTAEEKEQRKNERILRNRRAADKSRQRQKAAVAELEAKTVRMEQENASLRALLFRYEERFGKQSDFPLSPLPPTPQSLDLLSAPSPLDLKAQPETSPMATTMSYDTPDVSSTQPTLVHTDSASPIKLESPALAPTLNLINEQHPTEAEQSEEMAAFEGFPTVSGMAQYPAVILCDLQCQPEMAGCKLPALPSPQTFSCGLSYLLQTIQVLTIFHSFSTTTLLPIYNLFRILAQRLSTTSTEQDFSSILANFPLIHSLISMPSTPTRPAVFRIKLLSRLLACSPHMARLLLAATDRALQQVVSEEGFAEDADRRWTWSSLMTIKWVILRLEREHRKIRRQVWGQEHGVLGSHIMAGVDYRAVARSSRLWQQGSNSKCNSIEESWVSAPEVH